MVDDDRCRECGHLCEVSEWDGECTTCETTHQGPDPYEYESHEALMEAERSHAMRTDPEGLKQAEQDLLSLFDTNKRRADNARRDVEGKCAWMRGGK